MEDRPYLFKFAKGCLLQNLLSPLLNIFSHLFSLLWGCWFFLKIVCVSYEKMQCSLREELLCSELSENQVFLVSNLTPSLLHFSGKNTNQFQNLYLPYLEQLVNTTCKDFVCEDVTFYCNTLFPVASCKWLWHWCPPLWCKTSVSLFIICESNSSKI